MKNFILLIFAFIISFNSYGQDIPNGNMEDWSTVGGWFEIPDNWSTLNSQLITHTEKDTLACQGDFALKVNPLLGTTTIMGVAETSFPFT